MFKFEAKPIDGQLRICVSKESPSCKQQLQKEHVLRCKQKSKPSGKPFNSNDRNSSCKNSTKSAHRPHTTPLVRCATQPLNKTYSRGGAPSVANWKSKVLETITAAGGAPGEEERKSKELEEKGAACGTRWRCRVDQCESVIDIVTTAANPSSLPATTADRFAPESTNLQELIPISSQVRRTPDTTTKYKSDLRPDLTGRRAEEVVLTILDSREQRTSDQPEEDSGGGWLQQTGTTEETHHIEDDGPQSIASSPGPNTSVPRRMSLVEHKRLQWAMERAQLHEWNPWGRPGGGAPLILHQNICTGSQMSDLQKSNNSDLELAFGDDENVCKNGNSRGPSSRLPPLSSTVSAIVTPTSLQALHAESFATVGLPGETTIQNMPNTVLKEEARRQWLEELERQRDEQRYRKIQEKLYYQKNLNDMNIQNNVNSTYSSSPASDHQFIQPTPTTATSNNANVSSVSSPTEHLAESGHWNYDNSSKRSYLRGGNIPLDPDTQNELVKKREMALEHQKAIRMQLEDRLRLKQEEKQRRRKEEMEEEERLRKECEAIEQRYLLEQKKLKAKKNASDIDNAKQQQHVENKPSNTDSKCDRKTTSQMPDVLDGTKPIEIRNTEVPTEVDLDDSGALYLSKNTNVKYSPYVLERVLTPTKYRDMHLNMRDFSVQTDLPSTITLPLKKHKCTTTKTTARSVDDDSDVPSSEASNNCKRGHKHRSNGGKVSSPQKRLTGDHDRPQWGVNRPAQNYKTQSEKYLNSRDLKPSPRRSRTRRDSNEYPRSNRSGEEQSKNKQLGSKKTRSSAEHQRKLLAQEEGISLNAQSLSRSSVRSTVTQSPETREDLSTGELLTTRRQRRQWQSPGRDEMPNFYTDSPQLPDVRNVRRGTSNNSSQSKEQPCSTVGQSSHDAEEHHHKPFKSTSPPVPALKNRLPNHALVRQWLTSPPTRKPVTDVLVEAQQPNATATNAHRSSCPNGKSLPNIAARLLGSEVPAANGRHCLTALSSTYVPDGTDCSSTFSWQREPPVHRLEILKKLFLVRKGLILKQQEVEHLCQSLQSDSKPNDHS